MQEEGGGKSTANKDKIIGFRSHRKTGCSQREENANYTACINRPSDEQN